MVDRRNDRIWWAGRVTWSRLKLKNLPKCEDCWLNLHVKVMEAGGSSLHEGWIPRARHRRKIVYGGDTFGQEAFRTMCLCDIHKQEWLDWTPGQQVLS